MPFCRKCGSLLGEGKKFCVRCGAPVVSAASSVRAEIPKSPQGPPPQPKLEAPEAYESPADQEIVHPIDQDHADLGADLVAYKCSNCGAAMAYDVGALSLKCPFCGTLYAMKENAVPKIRRPESVIPFAVTKDQAEELFRAWLSKGFWAPNDMKDVSRLNKLVSMYVPMWVFSAQAHTNWSAQSGMFRYRQVAYTMTEDGREVTRLRNERYTEWYPTNGTHDGTYPVVPVPASPALVQFVRGMRKGLSKRLYPIIDSYKYGACKPYDPRYMLGCSVDSGLYPPEECELLLAQRIQGFEQAACYSLVPGDEKRGLQCNTSLFDVSHQLAYVPIYLSSYEYKNKVYHFIVNGQTGQIISDNKPVSAIKVIIALVIAAIVIAGVVAWIFYGTST